MKKFIYSRLVEVQNIDYEQIENFLINGQYNSYLINADNDKCFNLMWYDDIQNIIELSKDKSELDLPIDIEIDLLTVCDFMEENNLEFITF